MAARGKTNSKYQGMKWISHKRRLAIYLRDGLACVYCHRGIETGIRLTLDHIAPYSAAETPDHSSANLLTACVSCNSQRGDLSLARFAKAMASALRRQARRPLDLLRATELLEGRNFSSTLATLQKG